MSLHTHVYKRDRKITLRFYPHETPVFITLTTEQARGGLRTQGPQLTSSQWCRFMQLPWSRVVLMDNSYKLHDYMPVSHTCSANVSSLSFSLSFPGSDCHPGLTTHLCHHEKMEFQGHWFNTSEGFQDGTNRAGNSPGPSE